MPVFKLVLLILACISCAAYGSLNPSAPSGKDLTSHTKFLVPPPDVTTLEHILATPLESWKSISGDSINLGFHDNESYWFRVTIPECASDLQKRLLEIAYPLLDTFELWSVDANQRILSHELGGDKFPFSQRSLEHLAFAYPLGCQPQQTVYLRVVTTSAIQLPLVLWEHEDFTREHSKLEKVYILYFGAMGVMLFYNFFLMLSVQKRIYLYYVFFLLSYLCFQAGITGLGFSYVWPEHPALNDYFIDKPLTCTLIACFLFATSFLETAERFPKLYRLMMISVRFFLAWIVISFFVSYSVSVRVVIAMIIYGIGIGFYLATVSIMAGVRQGRFFAGAWISFMVGTGVLALNKFGLIPRNLFTENAHQLGSIIEALLFSFALADQMNVLRKSLAVVNVSLEKAIKHIEGENQRLESIVTERTADLRSKTRDLGAILENLPQGVLVFDAKRNILPTFSRSLTTLLGREEIAGADIFEILFQSSSLDPDALEQIQSAFQFCFGEDRLNFDLNRAIFPDRLQFDKDNARRFFELGWSPLCSEVDSVEYILLTISDVTDLKILEQESYSLQQRTRVLESYVDGTFPRMRSFLMHGLSKVDAIMKIASLDPESVHAMFREIHTIKGNARTFRLNELAQRAHEFEMDLSDYRDNPESVDRDLVQIHLEDILQRMTALLKFMDSLSEDKHLSSGGMQKASFDLSLWQRFRAHVPSQLPRETWEKSLAELEYVRAADYFHKLGESCPIPQGKLPPRIVCDIQQDLYVAEDIVSRIHDCVVHLIRNSMDHGIEIPDVRQQKGKPESGLIVFSLGVQNGQLVIHYHDDGAGLDLRKIKQKALEKKLCHDPEAPLSEALSFIFMPGFSTADAVSLTSGRGVGMDVVRQEIDALKGTWEWAQEINEARMPFDIRMTLGISSFLVYDLGSKAA